MFFENFKPRFQTNSLQLSCLLLAAIISSLILIQLVRPSAANQLTSNLQKHGSSHKNRDASSSKNGNKELFELYRSLFENDGDKLIRAVRQTSWPRINQSNDFLERSDDAGGENLPSEPEIGGPPPIATARASERRIKLNGVPDVDERAILALVASGSGSISSEPALTDKLNVASATQSQIGANLNAVIPVASLTSGGGDGRSSRNVPILAELTAAGTVAGLMMSDLAAQADTSDGGPPDESFDEDSGGDFGQGESSNSGSGRELYGGLDKLIAKSSLPLEAVQLEQRHKGKAGDGQYQASQQNQDHQSPDSMPESLEGLMGVDGDKQESEQNGQPEQQQQDSVASNLIQNESDSVHLMPVIRGDSNIDGNVYMNSKPKGDDDGDDDGDGDGDNDYDDDKKNRPGQITAAQLPGVFIDGHQPQLLAANVLNGPGDNQLQLMHNLPRELNAAAGHNYDKKKKIKKVVIKKKVKKKKYKKKKVKIVKYKKTKKKPKKIKKKRHHRHDHGKYYMYAKVPKKKAWEFGFKKGNKKHWIERHEKGYKNKFKTKVKWFDKKSKGKGVHIWDYNHHDKKRHR